MNDQSESIKQVSEAVARAINAVTDNSPQIASAAFDAMKHGVVLDGWIGAVALGIATAVALLFAVPACVELLADIRRRESAKDPTLFLVSGVLVFMVIALGAGAASHVKKIVAPEAVVINQILEKVK